MTETNEVAVELAKRILAHTGYVVVSKTEAEAYEEAGRLQRPWNLIEFAKWARRSPKWVKENILYVPWIKSKIDQASGGWVKYSIGNGSPWAIPVKKTKEFVRRHGLLEK